MHNSIDLSRIIVIKEFDTPVIPRLFYSLWVAGILAITTTLMVVSIQSLFSFFDSEFEIMDVVSVIVVFAATPLFWYLAWQCRIGIFPFDYVVDVGSNECGFYYKGIWAERSSYAEGLSIKFSDYRGWSWYLENEKGKAIYSEPLRVHQIREAVENATAFASRFEAVTGQQIDIVTVASP